MPIPTSRADPVEQFSDAFEKLRDELAAAGPNITSLAVSRWISINTTRQYVTARTYVRKAVRTFGDVT